ncbi:hypothetical protein ABT09_02475, partial [bacterium SCN 57-13]
MKKGFLIALGLAGVCLLTGCGGGGGGDSSAATYGVTDTGRLVKFKLGSPGHIDRNVVISGLEGGESILAIDFRASNGLLYGLGSTSRLYAIDPATGEAAAVGGVMSPLISGQYFGIDFNEVTDELRLVSDTEQNLRIDPDTGAVINVETPVSPVESLVACAYTPASGGLTTLYGIDAFSNKLVRIGGLNGTPSPDLGEVTEVGSLGHNAVADTELDIHAEVGAVFCTNS